MTPAKSRRLSATRFTIRFAISLAIGSVLTLTTSPVFASGEDIDEVRPHGFTPSEQNNWMHFPRGNRREMTASSPEEAQKMANSMKAGLDAQHQKYTYRQDGLTHTIVVESTKKTVVFTSVNPNAAKQEFHAALAMADLFPQNEHIAFLLSRLYENERNWSKALEYYRKANSLSNQATIENIVSNLESTAAAREARFQGNCAYFELMMKHYETAIRMLTKAIESKPDYMTSYHNRSKAYRALHKDDLAQKDEKKLQELAKSESQMRSGSDHRTHYGHRSEHRMEGYGSLALMMVELGSLEQALLTADSSLKKDPKSASALLAQARTYLRMGQYAKALSAYKKLEARAKDSVDLKAEMATAANLTKQGPPPYGDLSVIPVIQQPDLSLNRGRSRFSDFPIPVPISKIAADHKGDYRVYNAICYGLKEKSLIKPLDAELSKMLAIVPSDTKVIEKKIEAAEALCDWSSAEKYCNIYFDQLTKGASGPIKPEFAQYAFGVRGLARRAQKNFAGAIEDDTNAIKLAPESALAYRDRGDCYRQTGKYDLAVADYTRAIQLDSSKSSSNYWRRAKSYEKLNKANLAKQDLEMAKKLDVAQSKI